MNGDEHHADHARAAAGGAAGGPALEAAIAETRHSAAGHEHQGREHGGHVAGGHDHREMIADYRRRFWVSLALTVPMLALAPVIQRLLGVQAAWRFPGARCGRRGRRPRAGGLPDPVEVVRAE